MYLFSQVVYSGYPEISCPPNRMSRLEVIEITLKSRLNLHIYISTILLFFNPPYV